jgi:phosphoglucomutase/phosphomannomutase
MTDTQRLQDTRAALTERYGDLGRAAAEQLARWLSGSVPYAHPEILEQHLGPDQLALLFDAFWQIVPFGTGGRRGRVGYGPNRINPTTVALTVEGHCRYLRESFGKHAELSAVVANDTRVFNDVTGTYAFLGGRHPLLGVSSRSLAKLACEIYAGNGITAYMAEPDSDSALLTTPELSFLIPQLKAAGGVMLSASHNPPDDNGLKLYDTFGSQPVAPDDQRLLDIMRNVAEIKRTPFAQARAEGRIRPIPPAMFFAPRRIIMRRNGPSWARS